MEKQGDLLKAMRERIMLLDGAMGTMFLKQGFSGNLDRLNLTAPDAVASVHRAYIEAGAEIVKTNTFNGLSKESALTGARIARKEADLASQAGRHVLVAGSVGPAVAGIQGHIDGLLEGGVDLFLVETCLDADKTTVVLDIIRDSAGNIPVIVSVSPRDKAGHSFSGQTLEAFYESVRHFSLAAFGLNCSLGPATLLPLIGRVAGFCEEPVVCYPSAGEPDGSGNYRETPEKMAATIREMAEKGFVNIVGGCCGTTPEHIAAMASAISGIRPR